jgi:hypothetical protein
MFQRFIREIQLPYLILLSIVLLGVVYIAITAVVPFTVHNVAIGALVYIAFYKFIFRNKKQMQFLRQLRKTGIVFTAVNLLLCTVPFLFLGTAFWGLAVTIGIIILCAESVLLKYKIRSNFTIVLPSVFLKHSYHWHAQSRPALPLWWMLLNVMLIIACRYENFNLAIVAFGGITIIVLLSVILQYESLFFVKQYSNVKHFVCSGLKEIFVNVTIFLIVPTLIFLVTFTVFWKIIVLAFLVCYIVAISLLWLKYLFFGTNQFVTSIFIALFFCVQTMLVVAIYGIPVAILFQYLLYKKFYSSTQKLLCNEDIEN